MERFEASMNQETVGCKVSTPSKRLEGSLQTPSSERFGRPNRALASIVS